MIERIKQVYHALRAQITTADILFVDKYLSSDEKYLFMQMNIYDRKHAINTAYSARKLMTAEAAVNENVLIKTALLHDIGRTSEDTILFDKIIFVLVKAVSQNLVNFIAVNSGGGIIKNRRRALYICEHHAEIAAAALKKIHEYEVADIILRHHWPDQKNDSLELRLLRQADKLN